MSAVRWPVVGLYLSLAFASSWLIIGVFVALGGAWGSLASIPVGVLFMYGPTLAAILTQRRAGEGVLGPLEVRFNINRGWIFAWLAPLGLALATLGVSLLLPGVALSLSPDGLIARFADRMTPEQVAQARETLASLPVHPFFLAIPQSLAAGAVINPLATFGEELGWRGLLHRELSPLGFWRRALLTGLVWGLWHAPIIALGHNYPEHPLIGVPMMVAFCVLLSPLMSEARERSGSTLGAALAHGSVNATAGLPLLVLAGGDDLSVGLTGLAGLITLGLVNLGLAAARRGR